MKRIIIIVSACLMLLSCDSSITRSEKMDQVRSQKIVYVEDETENYDEKINEVLSEIVETVVETEQTAEYKNNSDFQIGDQLSVINNGRVQYITIVAIKKNYVKYSIEGACRDYSTSFEYMKKCIKLYDESNFGEKGTSYLEIGETYHSTKPPIKDPFNFQVITIVNIDNGFIKYTVDGSSTNYTTSIGYMEQCVELYKENNK